MRGFKGKLLWAARRWLVLVVAGISTIIGAQISWSERFSQFEFEAEQRLQMWVSPTRLSNKIAIVEISPEDTKAPGSMPSISVPRHRIGDLIAGMKRVGASVVILDIRFVLDSPAQENKALADAVSNCAPLKLVLLMNQSADKDEHAKNGFRYTFSLPIFLPNPLPNNVHAGQSEAVPTGLYYGSVVLLCYDEQTRKYVENIALAGFRNFYGIDEQDVRADWNSGKLYVGTNVFQMGTDGDLGIDWPADGADFSSTSFTNTMTILSKGDPNGKFRNKVVIVGNDTQDPRVSTVEGFKSGMWMVAHALNTMFRVDQGKPRRILIVDNEAWAFCLALLVSSSLSSRRLIKCLGGSILALSAAFLAPPISVELLLGMPEVVMGATTCVVAFGLSLFVRTVTPGLFPVESKEMFEATVMHVDAMDSTPMVGRLGARSGGQLLSTFVRLGKRAVVAEGGTVIRLTGDGFVAVFKASEVNHHADAAVKTIQRLSLDLKDLAKTEEPIAFRAGFESGSLYGNGSHLHGMPLHISARLEALCSEYSVNALAGPTAAALVTSDFIARALGQHQLKGISDKVAVFAIEKR